MFTLLSGLWKYIFQKDEYCLLILGLDNAGKTVCRTKVQKHTYEYCRVRYLENNNVTLYMNAIH